jgi:hypothetical protein
MDAVPQGLFHEDAEVEMTVRTKKNAESVPQKEAPEMAVVFEPIKITRTEESKVRRASGSKARYVVPFPLSAKPPRDWEDIFDDVWRSHRKGSAVPKAQAYVRKNELVIECTLGEIKPIFPTLRLSVDAANEKYLASLKHQAEKNEKKRRKREEEKLLERTAVHEALEGLDFS